ncbi:MAG TPA: hypothetical protein VM325_05570 [Alphaproteobacteria bacterium]|nr:hypothetical protein [Alphaproteobacteria bacterium]
MAPVLRLDRPRAVDALGQAGMQGTGLTVSEFLPASATDTAILLEMWNTCRSDGNLTDPPIMRAPRLFGASMTTQLH